MFRLAREWLLRTWWGSLIAYAVLVAVAYGAIWQAADLASHRQFDTRTVIEPLNLPETFQGTPWPLNKRWFYHVTLSVLAGAHATLISDLWLVPDILVRSCDSREAVYGAIINAIRAVERDETASRTLFLGALHGHSGRRRLSRSSPNPTFASFDNELLRCVKSSGPGMWHVRELYNITTLDRLEEIVGWLRQTENEDGYEVRAFCEPLAISHLAPLVISDHHAFLSLEDNRFFRVTAGVHIEDRAAVALVLRYCETLWSDPRAFILRTGYGVDYAKLGELRARIAQVPADV